MVTDTFNTSRAGQKINLSANDAEHKAFKAMLDDAWSKRDQHFTGQEAKVLSEKMNMFYEDNMSVAPWGDHDSLRRSLAQNLLIERGISPLTVRCSLIDGNETSIFEGAAARTQEGDIVVIDSPRFAKPLSVEDWKENIARAVGSQNTSVADAEIEPNAKPHFTPKGSLKHLQYYVLPSSSSFSEDEEPAAQSYSWVREL